jgi:hypothetical protein
MPAVSIFLRSPIEVNVNQFIEFDQNRAKNHFTPRVLHPNERRGVRQNHARITWKPRNLDLWESMTLVNNVQSEQTMKIPEHLQHLPEASAYIQSLPKGIEGRLLDSMFTAMLIEHQRLGGPPQYDVDVLFVMKAMHTWLGESEWIQAILRGDTPDPHP